MIWSDPIMSIRLNEVILMVCNLASRTEHHNDAWRWLFFRVEFIMRWWAMKILHSKGNLTGESTFQWIPGNLEKSQIFNFSWNHKPTMSEAMAILCKIDFIDNIEVQTLFSNVSIASDSKDTMEYQRFLWNDVLHHRFRRTLGFARRGPLRENWRRVLRTTSKNLFIVRWCAVKIKNYKGNLALEWVFQWNPWNFGKSQFFNFSWK